MQKRVKLKLTRPKEPEFETSQRVRFVKIKSSAELEEEMMVKMPKFKARPLNKKVTHFRFQFLDKSSLLKHLLTVISFMYLLFVLSLCSDSRSSKLASNSKKHTTTSSV